jgi:regulator of protease activity HflC (stomatin/prohibitin superfamily)
VSFSLGDIWGWLLELLRRNLDDLGVVAFTALFAFVRAMGITVDEGQTGLKFSFGRATRVLTPGFYPLLPYLQSARVLPTRSRTLDLPAQRVETREALVFYADANLVYKIVDVRKALIEIDDLQKGMLQALGIGVQDVLRRAARAEIAKPGALDAALATVLARRLEPWGVAVERAGFKSITPDPSTLRITQLESVCAERRAIAELLERSGHPEWRSIALAGMRTRMEPRTRGLRLAARRQNRARRLRKSLLVKDWTRVALKQSGLRLRSRLTTGGSLARASGLPAPRESAAKDKEKVKAKAKAKAK